MYKGDRLPRVSAWMIGYYTAKQEDLKGLEDIPLEHLDRLYIIELAKRADRETKHLTRSRLSVDKLKNNTLKVVK